ncbi:phage portal protein family protein [Ectopseudomonas oleovorans]|uniref:phage portal protein family protein n=1 Tax=Ectopseudomonas oleovorans TaxID=301 RepID=UPI003F1DDF52
MDILRAGAKQLAATSAATWCAFIDLNFGPQERYPAHRLRSNRSRGLEALADALGPFIDRGLPVEASAILDKFGLAAPEAGAAILRPQNSMQPLALNHEHKPCGCPACGERKALNAEQQAREELDELVADELGDWVPVMKPVLDPVQTLAQKGQKTFGDFKAGLAGLLNENGRRLFY